MVTPRFIRTTEGKLVPIPTPVPPLPALPAPTPPPEVVEVEEVEEVEGEPGSVDDVSDVVSVSEEDVLGKPEDNLDPDEDLSDLFDVSTEDIMGPAPEPEVPRRPAPRRRLIRRTNERFPTPPGSIISPG